jgi:hypothetical protein
MSTAKYECFAVWGSKHCKILDKERRLADIVDSIKGLSARIK